MPSSKIRFPVDAETAFRDTATATAGGAAAGVDVTSDNITLDRLSAYWNDGDAADHLEMIVFGRVTEVVDSGGTIKLQASTDAAFTSPVDIVSKAFTAAGDFVLAVAREELEDYSFIRVLGEQADGTSGVEFWAYFTNVTR